MQLNAREVQLTFVRVPLSISNNLHTDVFALKNNKTVAETLRQSRYLDLQPEALEHFAAQMDQPLGTFLKGLKAQGDPFYRRFLNAYGDGAYCSFSITDNAMRRQRGLYSFVLGERAVYIGRCNDSFGKRINQGYGRIHPKNCFRDGQATNCHLNALVAESRGDVTFYVCPLSDKPEIDRLERELIQVYQPAWNIALRRKL